MQDNSEVRITINGREYRTLEEIPADVREKYRHLIDSMGDLAPQGGDLRQDTTVVRETITFNGRTYHSREELPPDVHKILDNLNSSGATEQDPMIIIKPKVVRDAVTDDTRVIGLGDDSHLIEPEKSSSLRWIVAALAMLVLLLLFLWLSGIRPANLFK